MESFLEIKIAISEENEKIKVGNWTHITEIYIISKQNKIPHRIAERNEMIKLQ